MQTPPRRSCRPEKGEPGDEVEVVAVHLLPHVGGSLPTPVLMDVGHVVPSPRHHQGEVGDPREEKTRQKNKEKKRFFLGTL